jgi:hypothetical protein
MELPASSAFAPAGPTNTALREEGVAAFFAKDKAPLGGFISWGFSLCMKCFNTNILQMLTFPGCPLAFQ